MTQESNKGATPTEDQQAQASRHWPSCLTADLWQVRCMDTAPMSGSSNDGLRERGLPQSFQRETVLRAGGVSLTLRVVNLTPVLSVVTVCEALIHDSAQRPKVRRNSTPDQPQVDSAESRSRWAELRHGKSWSNTRADKCHLLLTKVVHRIKWVSSTRFGLYSALEFWKCLHHTSRSHR